MGPDAELLAGVDAIYDTVLDASRWPEALDRVSAMAGAFGSMLMVADSVMRDLQINVLSTRIADADAQTYVATKLSEDELRWDKHLDTIPALTIVNDTEIWPDRDEYEAMQSVKWLHSWDFHHRSAVRLCAHGGWRDTVATIYTRDREEMSPAEKQRLGLLLPHMARAMEIRRPFTLLKTRYQAILSMLDHLGIGILVLLDDGHILLSNSEAERILDRGDALRRSRDGRLSMPDAGSDEVGQATLLAALANVRSGQRSEGTTVYLRRRSSPDPYVIDVASFREAGAELGAPVSGALLCLIDPEQRSVISTSGLAHVYGLTQAEADVCALMGEGRSTREIADTRGVTLDTVKAQSKAIFRKTLCTNRIELVRRALSITPPLLDSSGRRNG